MSAHRMYPLSQAHEDRIKTAPMKDDFRLTSRKVLPCFLMANALCGFPLVGSAQEASAETAQEHGVAPLEPIELDSAVDSVQVSMAKIQELSKSGIAPTDVLEFGDDLDWVQLVSGEWIKGKIKRMRDDNLEFDSDKLDMLNIDFGDVALVHSPRIGTYAHSAPELRRKSYTLTV